MTFSVFDVVSKLGSEVEDVVGTELAVIEKLLWFGIEGAAELKPTLVPTI